MVARHTTRAGKSVPSLLSYPPAEPPEGAARRGATGAGKQRAFDRKAERESDAPVFSRHYSS